MDRVIAVILDEARGMYLDEAWAQRFQAEPEVWRVDALERLPHSPG